MRRAVLTFGLVVSCSGGGSQSQVKSCLPLDGGSTCWELLLPLGSGGFPAEAGSNDSPKWEPGRWPLTLQPVIGPRGDLWMFSRTHAWSSTDGVTWTHHAKADWGERIWHELVTFDGKMWMFGG